MGIDYSTDLSYANNRLTETVVLHKDKPVWVSNVDIDSGIVFCVALPSNNRFEVDLQELDLTPIELGFVNEQYNCYYLQRVPSRQWRQGLRASQITSVTGSYIRQYSITTSSGFVNMVLGKYPSPEECLESFINEEASSKAFSKHFGFSRSGRKDKSLDLMFRGVRVGIAKIGTSRIITELDKKFFYLDEFLEEERNGRA
jgi:hypothetical protein